MSRRTQLVRSAEDNERASVRLRERLGLGASEHQERVTDWLLSAGAIPVALAVLALLVYLAISLIVSF